MTSVEEPEGVSWNRLSALVSEDTATHGVEVVVPMRICMPQSLRLLYALTERSASFSSSWKLSSNWTSPPSALISSMAICAPFLQALP